MTPYAESLAAVRRASETAVAVPLGRKVPGLVVTPVQRAPGLELPPPLPDFKRPKRAMVVRTGVRRPRGSNDEAWPRFLNRMGTREFSVKDFNQFIGGRNGNYTFKKHRHELVFVRKTRGGCNSKKLTSYYHT
jgi:hypothetical protein